MTKILIAYYSRTGQTRRLVESIAEYCDAELESLDAVREYKGYFGYLRAGREALSKTPAPIRSITKDPGEFDLVVVGTPVWAGNMSSPIRTYLTDQGRKFKRLAIFCAEGGSGGENVMSQIATLCARKPVAKLIVTDKEINSGSADERIRQFGNRLAKFEETSQLLPESGSAAAA